MSIGSNPCLSASSDGNMSGSKSPIIAEPRSFTNSGFVRSSAPEKSIREKNTKIKNNLLLFSSSSTYLWGWWWGCWASAGWVVGWLSCCCSSRSWWRAGTGPGGSCWSTPRPRSPIRRPRSSRRSANVRISIWFDRIREREREGETYLSVTRGVVRRTDVRPDHVGRHRVVHLKKRKEKGGGWWVFQKIFQRLESLSRALPRQGERDKEREREIESIAFTVDRFGFEEEGEQGAAD